MRFPPLGLAALLATVAMSASIPGLPQCAGNCVTSFGSCGQLDVKCICSDQSLLANLACCVSTACSQADQEATIKFADSLCAGQGVSNLPQSATCAPGASGQQSTANSASATGSSGSTTGSAAASTASASLSSARASVSSELASASSSVQSAASVASTSVESAQASAAASNSAAASSATASSAAGGKKMEVGFGMVVAGLVAAL